MSSEAREIVVTGANGFIGKNLVLRLEEQGLAVAPIIRETARDAAAALLKRADVVFHLAGSNRPEDPAEYTRINSEFASWVAGRIEEGSRRPLVIVASSSKASGDSEYGRSKLAGEKTMLALGEAARVSVWRLPNVFGKWARPNYNSAIATFCHNLARGEAITIDDRAAPLTLLHIDDLIDQWLENLDQPELASGVFEPRCTYETTVGEVARMLRDFAETRLAWRSGPVGEGLARALYATFVAYLPQSSSSYPLVAHGDPRGSFTEVLRTPDCGQVSVLTAGPGVTRGGHYHHSKVEKFVVVHGTARFRFRHVLTGETYELETSGEAPTVVETIPGWTHDITNTGQETMVALIWANENFDPERPDTQAMAL